MRLCDSANTIPLQSGEQGLEWEHMAVKSIIRYGSGVALSDASFEEGLISTDSGRTMVSVSLLCPPERARELLEDPKIDALVLVDTIAWADMPEYARKVFFGTTASPFPDGGRVSGKYLLPLAIEWVRQLRRQFVQKPIFTGAGVLRPCDVVALKEVGASGVRFGTARMLRPWNVWRIRRRASTVFKK
jgi:hypothetical protein